MSVKTSSLGAAAILLGLAASVHAAPYLYDDMTSNDPNYTFSNPLGGQSQAWVDQGGGDIRMKITQTGAAVAPSTTIRNDTFLTPDVKVEVDTNEIFGVGSLTNGLMLSEGLTPLVSGKGVILWWNATPGGTEAAGQWDVYSTVGPLNNTSGTGYTLLHTFTGVGKSVFPALDHISIQRVGSTYTFHVPGGVDYVDSTIAGSFDRAGFYVGDWSGTASQAQFDNLAFTDLGTSSVPEPTALALLAGGAGAVTLRRSRRS